MPSSGLKTLHFIKRLTISVGRKWVKKWIAEDEGKSISQYDVKGSFSSDIILLPISLPQVLHLNCNYLLYEEGLGLAVPSDMFVLGLFHYSSSSQWLTVLL